MAKFDPTKLTLGEVARVEELAGVPFDQIDESPKGRTLAALLLVKRRRDALAAGQPPGSVTWEQMQDVPFDVASAELGFEDDDEQEGEQTDPPAQAPEKPARKGSPKKS